MAGVIGSRARCDAYRFARPFPPSSPMPCARTGYEPLVRRATFLLIPRQLDSTAGVLLPPQVFAARAFSTTRGNALGEHANTATSSGCERHRMPNCSPLATVKGAA